MTGREIKALRRKHGLSQEALARWVGVSYATINRWERGSFAPTGLFLEGLRALAAARKLPQHGYLAVQIVETA